MICRFQSQVSTISKSSNRIRRWYCVKSAVVRSEVSKCSAHCIITCTRQERSQASMRRVSLEDGCSLISFLVLVELVSIREILRQDFLASGHSSEISGPKDVVEHGVEVRNSHDGQT